MPRARAIPPMYAQGGSNRCSIGRACVLSHVCYAVAATGVALTGQGAASRIQADLRMQKRKEGAVRGNSYVWGNGKRSSLQPANL
eukprot:73940-Pelagomonas_calceolata.AAC.1